MKKLFADAGYWIALLNPYDELHNKAKAVSVSIGCLRLITSEMILTEILNYFSGRGEHLREAVVCLVKKMQQNPNVTIIPQTGKLFNSALTLYAGRHDKKWSLTDCASIKIMQDNGIVEVLTYDEHFEQAGFILLLKDNN